MTPLMAVGPWQSVGAYTNVDGKLMHDAGMAFNPVVMETSVPRLRSRWPGEETPREGTREARIRVSLLLPETATRLAWRVVAFGKHGKELDDCGSMARPGVANRDYEFRGRLVELARIELQSREYESVPAQTVPLHL